MGVLVHTPLQRAVHHPINHTTFYKLLGARNEEVVDSALEKLKLLTKALHAQYSKTLYKSMISTMPLGSKQPVCITLSTSFSQKKLSEQPRDIQSRARVSLFSHTTNMVLFMPCILISCFLMCDYRNGEVVRLFLRNTNPAISPCGH